MRAQESGHSPRVGLKIGTVARRKRPSPLTRDFAQAENALLAIMFNQRRAEDLGHLARSVPSHHIHLPETILRRDVALCIEKVFQCLRLDGGNAVSVARYRHRSGQVRQRDLSIQLRQRGVGDVIAVGGRAQQNQQKGAGDPNEDVRAGPWRRGEISSRSPDGHAFASIVGAEGMGTQTPKGLMVDSR